MSADRLAELVAAHRDNIEDGSCLDALDPAGRFLLVEHNRLSATVWLSTWATPEEAAEYHDGQEYADDWFKCELIELSTGAELIGVTRTTFEVGFRTTSS